MFQEELETLLGRGETIVDDKDLPPFTVIYFTANWCGACRSLDLTAVEKAATELAINLLKCDVDQNTYSPGYCSVRSIPYFVAIKNKKIVGNLQSTDTETVITWMKDKLSL